MKKLLVILAAVAALASCSSNREELLKVYNWSDYIDESVIPEFEQWYKEQTGKDVKVIYQTFDINETMLSKIEKGHEDYDVVCPSDYIIERMLAKDLLLPIDRTFPDSTDYISSGIAPYIVSCFDKMNGLGKNANDYAVGYMWGSTGLLYNAKYVTEEEASTWDAVRNPKFADKIFIKEGTQSMDALMYYTSDENLAAVEEFMKDVKPLVAGWEADFGKDQMTQEHGWLNLTWSGDAVWAIEEAAEMGVELRYAIPSEGCTVWFDGWVIPKYAKNIDAARYWIDFMCRPDIVIRNVDVTGYVSVSCAPEVMEAFEDDSFEPLDLSYFFGEEATAVRTNPVLYPDREVILRSTMEHDWGENTDKLIAMWSRVKGDNASSSTYVIVGILVIGLAAVLVLRSRGKKSHSKRRRR